MSTPTPRPGFRRRPPRWRVACWLVLLVAGARCAARESTCRPPQDELAVLVAAVRAGAGRELFYFSDSAAVGFHPGRGWTLSVYVGHAADFRPADHLVLVRLDGVLRGELIQALAGDAGSLVPGRVEGPTLEAYLARSAFDVSPVDRAFADHYARAVAVAPVASGAALAGALSGAVRGPE